MRRTMMYGLMIAAAFVAAVGLGGCAVGPVVKQDGYGQSATNAVPEVVTMTQQPVEVAGTLDYLNTMTVAGRGSATRWTVIDADGIESQGNNEVRTDIAIVLPDGTKASAISGKDISIGNLTSTQNPDGTVSYTLTGLGSSASAPIRAQNEGLVELGKIITEMSEDQKAVNIEAIKGAVSITDSIRSALLQAFGVPVP